MSGRKVHLAYRKELVIKLIKQLGAKAVLVNYEGSDADAIAAVESDPRTYFVVSKECDKQDRDGSCAGHDVVTT